MQNKRRMCSHFIAIKETLENKPKNDHLNPHLKEAASETHDRHPMTLKKQRIDSKSNIKDLALSTRSTYEKSLSFTLQKEQPRSQPTPKFASSPSLADDFPFLEEKQNINTLNSAQNPYHDEKVRVYGSKKLIEEENWLNFFSGEYSEDDSSSLASEWGEDDCDKENLPVGEDSELAVSSAGNDGDSLLSNCSTSLPDCDSISCPIGCCSGVSALQKQ